MPNFVECVRSVSNSQTGRTIFNPKNAQQVKEVISGTERFLPECNCLEMGGVSTILKEPIATVSPEYRDLILKNLQHEVHHTPPSEMAYFKSKCFEPLSEAEIKELEAKTKDQIQFENQLRGV